MYVSSYLHASAGDSETRQKESIIIRVLQGQTSFYRHQRGLSTPYNQHPTNNVGHRPLRLATVQLPAVHTHSIKNKIALRKHVHRWHSNLDPPGISPALINIQIHFYKLHRCTTITPNIIKSHSDNVCRQIYHTQTQWIQHRSQRGFAYCHGELSNVLTWGDICIIFQRMTAIVAWLATPKVNISQP